MSLLALSAVYEHINKGGQLRLYGLGAPRYHKASSNELASVNFTGLISSVNVYKSSTGGSLVLFDNGFQTMLGDYTGRFVQTTALGAADVFANMTDHSFNDAAYSLLFIGVHRGSEFRLSFRDIFLAKWTTILDAQLAGSAASREGDPILTWQMFPQGISYLDSNLTYLQINQQLHISVDWWPDYEASLTYHIFLYINGSGHLAGYVARWAYWVESGVKAGQIGSQLKPKVIAGANTLNTELANQLATLPFTAHDLFYLPGRQVAPAAPGVITGSTLDDVTIVVQT